jgi:membrane fusion protein (multidrug efflux system)
MNSTHNHYNGNGATGTAEPAARETARPVETPKTLQRPDPDTGGKISTDEPAANEPVKKRRQRTLAAVAALIVAAAAGAYYFWFVVPFESTDDAFLEGHVIPMASQVSGRVAQLLVQDNQEVQRGDLILEIDPRDYEAKLAQAQADVAAARSQLDQANAQFASSEANAEEARANLAAVEAQAGYTRTNLARLQTIGVSGVSQDQIDAAETQVRATAAAVLVAQSKISAAEAQATLSQASVSTAKANIAQNEAALRQAELNLSYTRVTAPETGRVTRRVVEQGAYIQPGQSLMAIVPRNYWVIANFKETQLTHMRAGQPVEVVVDAYPDHKFKGHVDSIQNGAGARFSLFPPENATGNYIKVVQRVPVKIVLDGDPDAQLALGPGMSVDPKVRVR